MRLTCRKAVVLLAISLTACTDSLDPNEIPGFYDLNDINGRALPTYEAATPGLTRTIRSAGISIDFGNTAELVQAVTDFDGTEHTITTEYTYHRQGRDLIFDLSPQCGANANCIAAPLGTVPATHKLDLDFSANGIPIVYHFQRVTLAY